MKYPKRPALAAVISAVLACLGAESALAQLSAPPPPEGDRYFGVLAQGGATEPTSGFYSQAFNDSHGTPVSGTVGASREGVGETQPTGPIANMHGVAFNADICVSNTHKTDGVLDGFLPATRRDNFKI